MNRCPLPVDRHQCPDDGQLSQMRVVVMGLGRFGGGIGVTRFLARRGARVVVTDRASESALASSIAQLRGLPVEFQLGGHDAACLDDADLLIISPAVDPNTNAFVAAALKRELCWTTETNLFLSRCPADVVGITGSVGKSTTAAMLHAVLAHAIDAGAVGYRHSFLGGNIGRSLLADIDTIQPEDVVVLELSSFQLELVAPLRFRPVAACITNLRAHHLDRHGDIERYRAIKLNLLRYQRPGDAAVTSANEPQLIASMRTVTADTHAALITADDTDVPRDLRVPGGHNRTNAVLAAAMARHLGVPAARIATSLASFTGLPHRLQPVARSRGVRYFNDSKSTSPPSVQTAIDASDGPIVVLCGGKDAGAETDAFAEVRWGPTRAVICFGEAGRRIGRLVADQSGTCRGPDVHVAQSLNDATAKAIALAQPDDAVILSPGCSSYDAFANYEQRGQAFIEAVNRAAASAMNGTSAATDGAFTVIASEAANPANAYNPADNG